MKKVAFIFLLGSMCFQTVKAQKPDSLMINMSSNNRMLSSKDSVDHFLQIMFPADSSTGTKINNIKEFNTNKTLRLTGRAIIHVNGALVDLSFVGPFTTYYPNGKIYQLEENSNGKLKLIECRDSTGKILAGNGNGKWIDLDLKSNHVTLQGVVKDSLKDGEWDGMDGDRFACVNIYKNGAFVSGTYYFKSGKKYQYHKDEVEPMFGDGGSLGFNAYLSHTIRYPAIDRENGTQGKVIVTFVIERDGSLTNIKALRGPDRNMMDAVIQVIQQSPPWVPGIQNGMPMRVQFTISFAFSLADDKW